MSGKYTFPAIKDVPWGQETHTHNPPPPHNFWCVYTRPTDRANKLIFIQFYDKVVLEFKNNN